LGGEFRFLEDCSCPVVRFGCTRTSADVRGWGMRCGSHRGIAGLAHSVFIGLIGADMALYGVVSLGLSILLVECTLSCT